jgi:type III restriction enzyme
MQLKIYQENAIEDLLDDSRKLLERIEPQKLIFKAPTGSGKTIIMAEFLKCLINDREIKQSFAFIWTAPRQLHIQSKDKLENYFETSRALECSYFEDLDDRKIDENEILFVNWEHINKANAVYIRDNEQEFNLSKVLERTKEDGREIILIVDESHHHAQSDISNDLRKMIGPKLTIEVSATPKMQDPNEITEIPLEKVKAEGMIKKAVILNDDFDNFIRGGKIKTQKLSGGSEELIIDIALKKRKELVKEFQKEKVEINPLVLIQLPDRKTSLEDRIRERVESILKNKYKISTEKGNNKLAIWLSGEHINKEDIERQDSEVEVLIFKQAIALGWDCPRAQILVLFRQWHSPIFSIQTVGRIMRMPEPDKGYYKSEFLNYGYVYTNLDNIEIQEDIAKDYITIYTSKRRADYQPINLLSCYPKRHREKTRLSPLFTEIFLQQAKEYNLKKHTDTKARKFDLKIISDYKAEDVDALIGAKIVGDREIKASGFDLQKLFDFFVRSNLAPFYPEDRSVGRVKESIYKFFEKELKMWYGDVWEEIVQIILSDKNSRHFFNVLDKAKYKYQVEVVKRESEMVDAENWNIPEILFYGREYAKVSAKQSVMQPFFSDGKWKSEMAFINFLNKVPSIEWWFKNGDRDATFFAVPYGNGEKKPFYVDFIIKLKDGGIGLFDTKAGLTKQVAGPKIDGLYKYIQGENKKGKKCFGGIVTNTERNYRGRWVYWNKLSKELKSDLNNWKDLIL